MSRPRTCSLTLVLFYAAWAAGFCTPASRAAETFRVATYNLDNYLIKPAGSRLEKPGPARAQIRANLRVLQADVVALQEVGGPAALQELRASLRAEGLDYPHWELVTGFDTNIQVAVLSRFPVVARRPHTNDVFLLMGRRFRVSRGFLEVDIQVNPRYRFTLFTTHLKSRRQVGYADEAELREQEAVLLRKRVEAGLQASPRANLVVLGDFNDLKNSKTIRTLIGRGRYALVDTRPAERNGDEDPSATTPYDPRHITWTHYYGAEDTYSRIDYILLSPGMAREWIPQETFVQAVANWGAASDHRPVLATFSIADK
jgi:endonuclease/exonuclease/phosphatase family metal-dependent hydrolase